MDMPAPAVAIPSRGVAVRHKPADRPSSPIAADLRACLATSESQSMHALEQLCTAMGGVSIAAQSGNTLGALDAMKGLPVDVVLLECETLSAAAVGRLKMLSAGEGPAVIVISSRAELACAAFEADAVDFVEKPVSAVRLEQAFEKVRRRLRMLSADAGGLLGPAFSAAWMDGVPRALMGERDRKLFLLGITEIDYIESARNYVLIHARALAYIRRATLKDLVTTLSAAGYARISRSLLINLSAVHYVERQEGGTYSFRMRDGMTLESTGAFRSEVANVLRGMGHVVGRGGACAPPSPGPTEQART